MPPEPGGPEADSAAAAPHDQARQAPETPDLGTATRRLLDQGGETARAAAETAVALSALAEAELALARAAAPRALLLGLAAFGLALVAALYLLALTVALLHRIGLDWPLALAAATALAVGGAALLAWRAKRVWGLARFSATRRQFARLLSDPS